MLNMFLFRKRIGDAWGMLGHRRWCLRLGAFVRFTCIDTYEHFGLRAFSRDAPIKKNEKENVEVEKSFENESKSFSVRSCHWSDSPDRAVDQIPQIVPLIPQIVPKFIENSLKIIQNSPRDYRKWFLWGQMSDDHDRWLMINYHWSMIIDQKWILRGHMSDDQW